MIVSDYNLKHVSLISTEALFGVQCRRIPFLVDFSPERLRLDNAHPPDSIRAIDSFCASHIELRLPCVLSSS